MSEKPNSSFYFRYLRRFLRNENKKGIYSTSNETN
jgi:predicted ABC-type exoprotein transport system permease subunit